MSHAIPSFPKLIANAAGAVLADGRSCTLDACAMGRMAARQQPRTVVESVCHGGLAAGALGHGVACARQAVANAVVGRLAGLDLSACAACGPGALQWPGLHGGRVSAPRMAFSAFGSGAVRSGDCCPVRLPRPAGGGRAPRLGLLSRGSAARCNDGCSDWSRLDAAGAWWSSRVSIAARCAGLVYTAADRIGTGIAAALADSILAATGSATQGKGEGARGGRPEESDPALPRIRRTCPVRSAAMA